MKYWVSIVLYMCVRMYRNCFSGKLGSDDPKLHWLLSLIFLGLPLPIWLCLGFRLEPANLEANTALWNGLKQTSLKAQSVFLIEGQIPVYLVLAILLCPWVLAILLCLCLGQNSCVPGYKMLPEIQAGVGSRGRIFPSCLWRHRLEELFPC